MYWILLNKHANEYTLWVGNNPKGYVTRNQAVEAVKGKGIDNWIVMKASSKPPKTISEIWFTN